MKPKDIVKYKLLSPINKLLSIKYNLEKRNILKVQLKGGLCNKLYCLFAACEIAQKNNFQILEPEFGWRKKILFSDIYDIDFFNQNMSKYVGGRNIMIAVDSVRNKKLKKRIRHDKINLWEYAGKNLSHLLTNKIIYSNSMMVNVLQSLKLRQEFDSIIGKNLNQPIAVQIRIESDWVNYSKRKKVENNETLLIDPKQLIKMLKDFKVGEIFFTTGENQILVQSLLEENNIKSAYFYDNNFEYEINAAINFEILSHAQKFIGLSRSTFSNLITLKRHLILNNPENYIYNYGNEIRKRIDYGLYPAGCDSVNISPQIIKTRRKILLCLHLYYIDQADMFVDKINSALNKYDYDLFVTVNNHNTEIEQKFLSLKPDTKFIIVKNIGADIFPFITALNLIQLEDYDYIIKLHTKKIYDNSYMPYCPNIFTYIERQSWNSYLTSFLTQENMEKILISFEQNKNLGMVADYRVILKNFKRNKEITTVTKEMLKLQNLPLKITYPAGTMFVARAKIFNLLKQQNLTESDFHEYLSTSNLTGTFIFPRVMEQFIGNCANASGLTLEDVFTPKPIIFIGRVKSFFKYIVRKTLRLFFRVDGCTIKIFKIPILKISDKD